MITENDPMLPRKVDLEKNPSGTELKIAQHRELEKHGKYVAIPDDKTRTRIFVRNGEDADEEDSRLPGENKQPTSKMELIWVN